MTNPQLMSESMVKSWKLFLQDQEQDRDVHSPLLARAVRQEKQNIKEEIEISLFADDMILHIENSKRFH